MATSTRSRLQITQVVRGIGIAVAKERDALGLEIVSELQRSPPIGTPVRTNFARANWIPSFTTAAAATGRGRKSESKSAVARAQSQQQAAIAAIIGNSAPPDVPLIVSNHVPYIRRLNAGHSQQTAAGFVVRCVAQAVENRNQAPASSPPSRAAGIRRGGS